MADSFDRHEAPQVRPLSPGLAEIEWTGIRERIETTAKRHGIKDYHKLRASIYVNGIEVQKDIPWDQTKTLISEPKVGQIDYYVVYKRDGKPADISHWRLRETTDTRTLAEGSYTGQFPGENFTVRLNEALKAEGMSEKLTETAVRLGKQKVVWALSSQASQEVKDFITKARGGVDVQAEIGSRGTPTKVRFRNRETGEILAARPEDIRLKGDAAFSGNQFFWDDMWVAGGSVPYNPVIARTTIESWLDAHDLTDGPIPREIRKENGLSLWFPELVRFPEGPKPNLTYTNPYLINWAADLLYRYNPSAENLELLKRVSKSIDKYVAWIENPKSGRSLRDSKGRIIGFNGSALGSGLDNSRFSVGNRNEDAGHQRGFVDFLAQHIAMLKDNARWQLLFAKNTKSAIEKKKFVTKSRKLREAAQNYGRLLNEKYWDPKRNFYFDIVPDGKGGYVRDVSTTPVSGFWPLFAKVADPDKVNKIVDAQLVPEKFGGEAPIPSNSRDTLSSDIVTLGYTPRRNIQGEIADDGYHDREALWSPNLMMAAHGFRLSGRPDVAHRITRDFIARMAESSTETVEEAYGVDRVKGPDGRVHFRARPLVHANHRHRKDFAGWGKVPPILGTLQDGIGLHPTYDQGLEWYLRTPLKIGKGKDGLGVYNLQYAGGNVKLLEVQRLSKDAYEITVESEKPFQLRLGTLLDREDRLTAEVRSLGPKIRVAGGNKKETIQVLLKPVDQRLVRR